MPRISKYNIIVKIDTDTFHKYRTDNLISFTRFLDKDRPGWRYFNVYDKRTREQLGSFTRHRKPTAKRIEK